ncbi:MAG: GAF domain-containing protein [Candidatus Omnitrophica bacterium]|nr:GAF domain-containing protein [Candidatus Omnitrophota bacterium]
MKRTTQKMFIGIGIFASGYFLYLLLLSITRPLIPFYRAISFTVSMALIVFLYDAIKQLFTKAVNAMFQYREIDYRSFLKHFSNVLITFVDLNKLSTVIVKTLYDFYDLSGAAILLYREGTGKYTLAYAYGQICEETSLDMINPLVAYLQEQSAIIVKSRLQKEKGASLEVLRVLEALQTELCMPLIFKNKLIGILHLGQKRSGKGYTIDDVDAFATLESQIAVAINNAILFKRQEETHVLLAQKNKMDAIIALSSGINHEINNPLSIISMRCQNFLRKFAGGKFMTASDIVKNAQDVIESSLRNATRAHSITKRLANFARPSTEEMDFQPVNIKECVPECIDLIGKKQFYSDNIMIHIDIPDSISDVYADKVHFQQVLYNVVMNAYHAIEKKGTITFKAYEQGKMKVVLEVHDTGCGIAPEDLDKIWEPFYTTKPTNPVPGTRTTGSGLGLSLVKRYIESSGGTVDIKSTVGKGTIFYFTLVKVNKEKGHE